VVRVSAFGKSVRGNVREHNQDRLMLADLRGVAESPGADGASDTLCVGPVEFPVGSAGAILMVADGMGGRAGGARASTMAIGAVLEAMMNGASSGGSSQNFAASLERALTAANAAIHTEAMRGEQYRGMGTTATLAGIFDGSVYVAQVGDSRAYLARDGVMGRLTRDQSLVQDLIDSGILSEEDARSVPRNQILQALGPAPSVDPVLTVHELRRGDVLLLCSDGLSGVVGDGEIQTAVAAMTDLSSLCEELVGAANAGGGPDNITVLVARIDGDGVVEPGKGDTVERRTYAAPPS